MKKMDFKLFDSEKKVMEVFWQQGPMRASEVVKILEKKIGWNRNTTYTVIKKCVSKGAVERTEPHFMCRPLVTREQVQEYDTNELINKMFQGSKEQFFASFVKKEKLTKDEVKSLKDLVKKLG